MYFNFFFFCLETLWGRLGKKCHAKYLIKAGWGRGIDLKSEHAPSSEKTRFIDNVEIYPTNIDKSELVAGSSKKSTQI